MKPEMEDLVTSRRSFLKKAAYAAPAVVMLGSLTTASAAGGNNGNNGNAYAYGKPSQIGPLGPKK